jgi:acetyltransferase
LAAELPEECSVVNPVDLLASAGPERYEIALGAAMADPGIDAVLVIFVPPVMIDAPRVARVIHEAAARRREIPVLGCFMGQQRSFPGLEAEFGVRVPFYPYPEEAVRCLDRMARAEELRVREEGRAFDAVIDVEAVDAVLRGPRAERRTDLYLSESLLLAEAGGMRVAPWRVVRFGGASSAELVSAARNLPRPWVLKADVPARIHKMQRGLVALGLDDEEALERAAARMLEAAQGVEVGAVGWVVQSEVPHGREWLLGMVHDPVFGPLIAVGFGGTDVEAHRDVVFRLNPVTDAQARAMLGSLRGDVGLEAGGGVGAGSGARRGTDALLARIGLLSRLVEAIPDMAELDWNPVAFSVTGGDADGTAGKGDSEGVLLDARVRLQDGARRDVANPPCE